MRKSKLLAILLCVFSLCLCLTACGENNESSSNSQSSSRQIEVSSQSSSLSDASVAPNSSKEPDSSKEPQPDEPKQLATPFVIIDENAVASWSAVENAVGYNYILDNATSGKNTANTSVQLERGQTIRVKAVGDGVNYKDSPYCDPVTDDSSIPPSPPITGEAPSYLGVTASFSEPDERGGVPDKFLPSQSAERGARSSNNNQYRSLNEALKEYYQNEANLLGEALPQKADFEYFSRPGESVYIQIWLNNPAQHTILSLKINGTKYQVSGGLASFFIDEGGVKYNCVYVAVTIPQNVYESIDYTVSEIEYVSGTFINPDGTDEFMNDNDTLSFALPYDISLPSFNFSGEIVCTSNSFEGSVQVPDLTAILQKTGGFARAVVYDNYNILYHAKLTAGVNYIQVGNLIENSDYTVYFFIYADFRDGRGVSVHNMGNSWLRTSPAIEIVNVESAVYENVEEDKTQPCINIETKLLSDTAEYMKVEVLIPNYTPEGWVDGWENLNLVTTLDSFDGTATITDGILANKAYRVRIYYKDAAFPDGRFVNEDVFTDYLINDASVEAVDTYGLYDDVVLSFVLGSANWNGSEIYPSWHIDGFTLKISDKSSAQYIAEDVLYLIDNPGILETLNAEWEAMHGEYMSLERGSEEAIALYELLEAKRAVIERLEDVKSEWDWQYADKQDRSFWVAENAKGKYYYEFNFDGSSSSQIKKVNGKYYVLLEDFYTREYYRDYVYLDVTATVDKYDGKGLQEHVFNEESVYVESHFTDRPDAVQIKNSDSLTYDGGDSLTLSLFNYYYYDENHVDIEQGYVYKIVASCSWSYENEETLILYEAPQNKSLAVDETAWFNEYLEVMAIGGDVTSLHNKYLPSYNDSYIFDIDNSGFSIPGNYNIDIYTRVYTKHYEQDGANYRAYTRYTYQVKLDTPTVSFDTVEDDYRGVYYVANFSVKNYVELGEVGSIRFEYEIRYDDSEMQPNPVGTGNGITLYYGRKVIIRVKAVPEWSGDGWIESDWSAEYTYSVPEDPNLQ